jgi:hypothetical protein
MKWLLAIIEAIVRGLFRKSPEERTEAKYGKALKRWEEDGKILEADYDRTHAMFDAYVAGHHGTAVPGELERLHDAWSRACKALSSHRSRQPKNPAGGRE